MKSKEEILKPFVELLFRHSEVVDKDNAIKAMGEYGEECWQEACKAQMNAVFEHCQSSPQGTNGHAIKHWVKLVPFNTQQADFLKTGIELVAEERQEQIKKHNRTIADDVKYNNHYQLSQAASLLCYVDEEEVAAEPNEDGTWDFGGCCPPDWDNRKEGIWNKMMNKPYRERLIIAAALIVAEIDRMNQLHGEEPGDHPKFVVGTTVYFKGESGVVVSTDYDHKEDKNLTLRVHFPVREVEGVQARGYLCLHANGSIDGVNPVLSFEP